MDTPFEVAGAYNKRLQCVEYVNELCVHDFSGKVIVIDTQKIDSDTDTELHLIIMNIEKFSNKQISNTGLHYGFLIEDTVYDNLYPSGVNKKEWVSSFSYPTDLTDTLHPITDDHIRVITKQDFLLI